MVEAIERERGRVVVPGWPWAPMVALMKLTPSRFGGFRLSPGFRSAVSVGSPTYMKYTATTSALFVGAAAAAVAFAPSVLANPAPPPCVNADGTACADLGTAGPGGASGAIPVDPPARPAPVAPAA